MITSVCVNPNTGEVACWDADGTVELTQEAGVAALQGLMVALGTREDFDPVAFQTALMGGLGAAAAAPSAPLAQPEEEDHEAPKAEDAAPDA